MMKPGLIALALYLLVDLAVFKGELTRGLILSLGYYSLRLLALMVIGLVHLLDFLVGVVFHVFQVAYLVVFSAIALTPAGVGFYLARPFHGIAGVLSASGVFIGIIFGVWFIGNLWWHSYRMIYRAPQGARI